MQKTTCRAFNKDLKIDTLLASKPSQTSISKASSDYNSEIVSTTDETFEVRPVPTAHHGIYMPTLEEPKGCEDALTLGKYTESEIETLVSEGLYVLAKNFNGYSRSRTSLSQKQLEVSVDMQNLDQVERVKHVLKLLSTEITTTSRNHRDETERLRKEHKEQVDKLNQQFVAYKVEADSRYESLRVDIGHWKQKDNAKTLELKAEKDKHKTILKERDDELMDFKEKGRKLIQDHMERARKYQKKYDEEVASNTVMKLDFGVMTQMVEDNKAEKEQMTAKSHADELRIAELEKELGGLRSKRAMPALDQRTIDEVNELRRDKTTLQSDVSALKKQVETFKAQLIAVEKIQGATKAELDEEKAKPRNGEGLQAALDALDAEEKNTSRLKEKLESLNMRASLAEDEAIRWYGLFSSTIEQLNSRTMELVEERAKSIALQDKWERMKVVMDS